jgi:hypothetical protein
MLHLEINHREQCERLTTLLDDGFVNQNESRQLGSRPPTSLDEELTELPNPLPDHNIGPLEVDSPENTRYFPEIYTVVVQQNRRSTKGRSVHSRSKISVSSTASVNSGKFVFINSGRSQAFPSLSLS